jgi:hypothetical protein
VPFQGLPGDIGTRPVVLFGMSLGAGFKSGVQGDGDGDVVALCRGALRGLSSLACQDCLPLVPMTLCVCKNVKC